MDCLFGAKTDRSQRRGHRFHSSAVRPPFTACGADAGPSLVSASPCGGRLKRLVDAERVFLRARRSAAPQPLRGSGGYGRPRATPAATPAGPEQPDSDFVLSVVAKDLTGGSRAADTAPSIHAKSMAFLTKSPARYRFLIGDFGRGRFGHAPIVLMNSGTPVLEFNSQLSTSAGVIGRYSLISSNSRSLAFLAHSFNGP